MTMNRNLFSEFKEIKSTILTANNNKMLVKGEGNIIGDNCDLKYTLYIPDLSQNLISVNAITNNGGSVIFSKDQVKIFKYKS